MDQFPHTVPVYILLLPDLRYRLTNRLLHKLQLLNTVTHKILLLFQRMFQIRIIAVIHCQLTNIFQRKTKIF